MYSELKRIYDAYNCEALWDLGDTTDDRNAIPVPVIDSVCDCLEPFDGQWNIKLVGNHEQWLRSTKVHAGKMFRRYFDVVESTKVIRMENVNVLCVSYHDDSSAIVDFLRRCPRNVPTILLGHFQVVGCQMSSGIAATGVPLEEMKFAQISLLGHIHKPQEIGNRVHYVGSPFQQHWGETGEDKRVGILEIGGPQGDTLNWVPMTGFPRYLQVSFPQFIKLVEEKSEDRYKVVLKNIEETEQFYAHPLSNRADEAIYAYENQGAPETVAEDVAVRSKNDVMREYLRKNPPLNSGVALDEESMLQYGESLLGP